MHVLRINKDDILTIRLTILIEVASNQRSQRAGMDKFRQDELDTVRDLGGGDWT